LLYKLVDGQQRLTMLYLIYNFFYAACKDNNDKPKFSIEYQTRKKSSGFLERIDTIKSEEYKENIDFYFMHEAYKRIEDWFKDEPEFVNIIKDY